MLLQFTTARPIKIYDNVLLQGHPTTVFCKISVPKISPRGLYFSKALFGGLIFGGYERKFAFQNRLGQPYSWKEIYRFSLFYFVFESSFQVQAPPGVLYLEGRFNGGFLRYELGGFIFGGAYTWRGLLSEMYGIA